jgi:ATP-binding cassette subfamily B (MDR/TAP) protein 1
MQMKEQRKREEVEEKKEIVTKALPFYKLLSYADALDWSDWSLMALGTLGSIVHGMAQPIGYLLLGKALNAFGDNLNDTDATVKAIKKVS